MLSTGLLLSLFVYFVKSQHVSLPRAARDAKCRTYDLRFINDYFEKTTIIRNQYTTEPEYCTVSVTNQFREDSSNVSYPIIDLESVIYLYATLDYVNSYKYIDSKGPVLRDGYLSIGDDNLLPLYLIADIRRKHLPSSHTLRKGYGEDVDKQMTLMGQLKTDGRGPLLAHSIGGLPRALNVIPMAINIYLHAHFETSTDLEEPLADWRANEYWIRKFLLHLYPNGHVEWKMAIQYEDKVFLEPKQVKSYRPLSFSLQYTAYTDQTDNFSSIYYSSPNLTFLNDNHYSCKSRFLSYYDKDDAPLPKNCDIRTSNQNKFKKIKSILYYRKKNLELVNDDEAKLKYQEIVGFSYKIQESQYIYKLLWERTETMTEIEYYDKKGILHTERKYNWYLQYWWEIEAIDTSVTDKMNYKMKDWNKNFTYSFPFGINDRQFIYAHCNEDKSWVIRELSPTKPFMRQVTHKDTWPEKHLSCAPFTISGKQYFFSQWTNKTWFIRELLPDGKMGEEITNDKWSQIYSVVFTYVINRKHMLYAHNPTTTEWFVRELLHNGQMGKQLNSNKWPIGYHVSVNLIVNGRQFIYALSNKPPYEWFIRELLPHGQMGKQLLTGREDGAYEVAFTYECGKELYDNLTTCFYKMNNKALTSKIEHVILK